MKLPLRRARRRGRPALVGRAHANALRGDVVGDHCATASRGPAGMKGERPAGTRMQATSPRGSAIWPDVALNERSRKKPQELRLRMRARARFANFGGVLDLQVSTTSTTRRSPAVVCVSRYSTTCPLPTCGRCPRRPFAAARPGSARPASRRGKYCATVVRPAGRMVLMEWAMGPGRQAEGGRSPISDGDQRTVRPSTYRPAEVAG